MADWLRPVFTRTKTPIPSFSDHQSSFSADDKSEDGDMSKLRPTSRVSSYMNIRSSTAPIAQTPDSFANIRTPESVYHKPSVDHMAETLKVVMMNQSSMDPVPIAYNACILYVLEAYQDLRTELVKKENFLEALKLSHTKDINDFEALATQWETREWDYKTELKKLEVLLSQTEGGMEKVTLARSRSAVHGSRGAKLIRREIGTIRERNSERSRGESNGDFNTEKIVSRDATLRQSFHSGLNTQISFQSEGTLGKRQFRASILRSRSSASQATLPTYQKPSPEKLSSLTNSKLESSEQRQAEGEYGMVFPPSISSRGSSTRSSRDGVPHLGSRVGLGIDIEEKPLPRIPPNQEPNKSRCTVSDFATLRYPQFDAGGESPEISPQLGFSFVPGDDTEILTQKPTKDLKSKRVVGIRTYEQRNAAPKQQSEESYPSMMQDAEGPMAPKSTHVGYKPKLQGRPGRDLQDCDALKRDGSTSSIITAVCVGSRRSSVDSSRCCSQNARRGLNRNPGSNEAVTAAVRALASASASASVRSSPRRGSNCGTREED